MLQSFNVPAKGAQITAQGNYLRLEAVSAAGADESVRVRADGQDLGFYLPGDSITLPVSAVLWEVVPVTQTATAAVRIGVAGVQSSRMFGNVRIIDQAGDKTASGSQFWGAINRSAQAGEVAIAGLFNSGTKTINVRRLLLSSGTAGGVNIWTCTGLPTVNGASNANGGANKLAGGAGSSAWAARGGCAGTVPTGVELPGVVGVGAVFLAVDNLVELPISTPFQLRPGFGLVISGGVVNRGVSSMWDFEEL